MVTVDDVRRVALGLPGTTEHLIRDRVKFRVKQLVYVAFTRDETVMGFAFPKEQRLALVESEPQKFQLPPRADMRYHWVDVRMAALAVEEMTELVTDAWTMVVSARVARTSRPAACDGAPSPIGSHLDRQITVPDRSVPLGATVAGGVMPVQLRESGGLGCSRTGVAQPGDRDAHHRERDTDVEERLRLHQGQADPEEERAEGRDRRGPADHAAGLPALEDHRHLLERRGVADAREQEDGQHAVEELAEVTLQRRG